MSGGKVNKAVELLRRAVKDEGFALGVELYRNIHGIPPDGFADEKSATDWLRSKSNKRKKKNDYWHDDFKRAMLGPSAPATPGMIGLLDSYLLMGSRYDKKIAPSYAGCLEVEYPTSEELKWAPLPFFRLRVYSNAAQEDVKEMWSAELRPIIKELRVESTYKLKQRIRPTRDRYVDTIIHNLWAVEMLCLDRLLSLMLITKNKGMYREDKISAILAKRDYTVSPRSVKEIALAKPKAVAKGKIRRYT